MNNVGNMNAMAGGPVGGPGGVATPMMGMGSQDDSRSILNTYIYDYFIRENMDNCARAMLDSGIVLNVDKDRQRKIANGAGDGDAMDTDNKDDMSKANDLPPASVPDADNCFLYEWFCLFWDMLTAQRPNQTGGKLNPQVQQYVNHTQQQSRLRQNAQQQEMLRAMRPDGGAMFTGNPMMRNMPNGGLPMNKTSLARTAMANNQNNPNAAMQMLPQGAKQPGQMQRDASEMEGNRRPASPGSAENAPSPSKRPRLNDAAPFNPQQPGMMNGNRPQQGVPGNQVGNGPNTAAAAHAHQMLIQNGINPQSLTQQQFQTFQQQPPHAQQKSIATYSQNLQHHHGQQMPNKGPGMANAGGPQGQGSPMMPQGPDGSNIAQYYNPEMAGPGGMRPGPAGAQPGAGGSNHALQDYQMQLMLLEQQNKKRLMMARQEQDSMGNLPRGDGAPGAGAPGAPAGPNGQPFQDTSPQSGRPGASPNPSEQMKRGTPQMGPAGIPSPLPEGGQSRGSPNPMGFMPNNMPNNMDPNMAPHFFKNMNGMDGNMVAAQMNGGGMRPPSSHPGQPFNGQQMTQQQMIAQRQQQAQQGGAPGMPWQGQQNGNAMGPQGPQGQGQTPQQRSMPPPSAPGAPANANGRNPTASPQTNPAAPPTPSTAAKPAPKKKETKNSKSKAAAAKKTAQNAAATPAADASQDGEPATPATPITPVNANFKNGAQNAGNGAAQPAANAPAAAPQPAPTAAAAQSDANQMGSFPMEQGLPEFNIGEFTNPTLSDNVLQDFDFDSFLHEDGDGTNFAFDASAFGIEGGNEIPTGE